MSTLICPPKLKHGDLVGIAAPAAPLWPAVPAAANVSFQRGLEMLRRLGLCLRIAPHALSPRAQPDIPAYERAEDLNALFGDPEVRAILCVAGGWGGNAVLPVLDWSAIERHPKIVMGYSNTTALLLGIATRARLVTFHGPTILDGFSEFPEMLPYTREQMEKVICAAQPAGVLHPPAEWTSDYPHDDRPRQMEPNPGWRWLQPGQAQGRLVGGHLTTLRTLTGTPFWPSLRDTILFLEDLTLLSPTMAVQHIAESLAHLQMLGVFDEIAGLVVGKIAGLSAEDDRLLEELLRRYVRPYRFPVLTHVDLGHTDPKMTLPIGVQATLDSQQDRFSIDEAAVI